jgi:hypothetical protein
LSETYQTPQPASRSEFDLKRNTRDARNYPKNQVLAVAFQISRSADSYFFERKSRVAPDSRVTIGQYLLARR